MAELQTELAKAQAESPRGKQPAAAQEPEDDDAAQASADQEPKKGRASKDRAAPKAAKGSSSGESQPSAPSPVASEARAPSSSHPKKGSAGATELDDLLGEAKTPPAQKSAGPDTPQASKDDQVKETLDRSDVLAGMNSVAAMVKQCAQGQEGTVTVEVVIGPAGRVMNANPKGTFAGTPVGACAARAVRTARFPTSKKSITVTYPFKL
jgi:hypothetical protein